MMRGYQKINIVALVFFRKVFIIPQYTEINFIPFQFAKKPVQK